MLSQQRQTYRRNIHGLLRHELRNGTLSCPINSIGKKKGFEVSPFLRHWGNKLGKECIVTRQNDWAQGGLKY
jgi:hypothetical protein